MSVPELSTCKSPSIRVLGTCREREREDGIGDAALKEIYDYQSKILTRTLGQNRHTNSSRQAVEARPGQKLLNHVMRGNKDR